jgi:hypothetical protein
MLNEKIDVKRMEEMRNVFFIADSNSLSEFLKLMPVLLLCPLVPHFVENINSLA